MKIDEIMKLIDAGFTRDEIKAMEDPEPASDPVPASDPAPASDPTPAADPAPAEMEAVLTNFLTSFKTAIDDLKAANIGASSMPEQHNNSAEEVLASIIAPPAKTKK